MGIFAKLAGQNGIPVFEIVLVRGVIVTAFAAASVCRDGKPDEPLLGHRRWLLLVRGMCGFGAARLGLNPRREPELSLT
jgi:drug/metabolite transporter (DMT)-like permease